MFKKLRSLEIKFRYLIYPAIVYFVCNRVTIISEKLSVIDDAKIGVIISMSGIFLGMLLATFTLYLSFARTNKTMQRVINSGHDKVFKNSIIVGSAFFFLSIIIWIFDVQIVRVSDLFLMGVTDVIISIWYIYVITDYL